MKILKGLAAGLVATLGIAEASAEEPLVLFNPYVGGGVGFHQNTFSSGGVVDFIVGAGSFPFQNSGRESDEDFSANLVVGMEDFYKLGPVALRPEIEVWRMSGETIRTGGFPGPPTPAFFYDVRIDQSFGMMFNLWGDIRPFEDVPLILSGGAGVGITNLKVSVADNQADPFIGTLNQSKVTYQLGAQLGVELNEFITAGVAAKYMDIGNLGVTLFRASNTEPQGTYKLDWNSRQVMGFVRIDLNALDSAVSGN